MSYNQVTPASLNSRNKSAPPPTTVNSTPQSSSHPTSSHEQPQQQGLPHTLTHFVAECHRLSVAKNFSIEQTTAMQIQLRTLIEKANNEGKIWTNDWERQKIPAFNPEVPLELYININAHMNKRAEKFGTGKTNNSYKVSKAADPLSSKHAKRARAERFERELSLPLSSPSNSSGYQNDFDEDSFSRKPLVGLSQTYLKNYFRLTSAPDPMNVRPLPILKKTLEILVEKYNNGEKYTYICDQLKSMRQDLRVQNIQEEFTAKVYETHAKIAIENGDLGEFNQCQTMLSALYSNPSIQSYNKLEFLSYKILYQLFTGNYDSIFSLRLKLTSMELSNEYISTALKIFKAMTTNNYHKLFRLYSLTIKTTRKLIDNFINTQRIKALAVICHAYNVLSLEFLLTEFRFKDEEDCYSFFKNYKLEQFMELKGENMYLNAANARPTVLSFQAKAKKIDIKGQI